MLISCEDDAVTVEPNDYEDSPSSKVPDALIGGSWFYGTVSPVSYYDQNGNNLGNDYEAGREYQFSNEMVKGKAEPQGRFKFWQYLGTRSYSCVKEYYTYKEGTVKFEGADKFTLYPISGRLKKIKKDCSSDNGITEEAIKKENLEPSTYLFEIKDIDGVKYIYTYHETDLSKEEVIFVYKLYQ